jgi:hypothetical protein
MVVGEEGEVFVWDFLDANAMGEGEFVSPTLSLPATRPSRVSLHNWIDNGAQVAGEKRVATGELGAYSGALVTEDGELFCFGLDVFGGTGQDTSDNVLVPTRVR